MINMNKITNTRVGDEINYFVNGVESTGTVVKMSNSYVTVFKSGKYEDIPLNETFFVKDIVLNKTWDSMDDGERLDALSKAHVPSPRYVTKTWDQLPKDLQVLLTKNNSSNVSAKEGKDDDENVTQRIFDKALSGDANYKRQPKGEQAVSNSQVTEPTSQSGGFKLNQPIGSEGASEHGGHGKTGKTRQQGVREREPSAEEEKGASRGTSADSGSEAGDKFMQMFRESGITGSKDKDKAWVSWLADRKDDVMKDAPKDLERPNPSDTTPRNPSNTPMSKERENEVSTNTSARMREPDRHPSAVQEQSTSARARGSHNTPSRHDPNSADVDSKNAREGGYAEYTNRQGKGDKPTIIGNEETVHSAEHPVTSPADSVSRNPMKKAIERLNELKSNIETSIHGNAGRYPNSGVSTSTHHDAPKDYEGASHSGIRLEQFKHENKKPQVKKEQVDLGDTKPTDVHDGGNKYDTKTQPKTINGRAADQEKDKKI
jgi:hypothetical protein